jgi:predicted ATP-grasp superfamily ATP-dependent carboligase
MRLLIYEWCCSGGLKGPDALGILGPGPRAGAGILPEASAMFAAMLEDALMDPDFEIIAVVDATLPVRTPAGIRVRPVPPGAEIDVLREESQASDRTLVVAPETDGIFGRRVAAVREAGGTVLAPPERFIATAADKQAAILALAAAGVPVPAGRSLVAGQDWPANFPLPAVRKPRDGIGCDGLVVVRPGDPPPPPAPRPTRVEAFAAGTPVGVSCLCGPGVVRPLEPMRQRFAAGQPPRYLGGERLGHAGEVARAERLAVRAVGGLARETAAGDAAGWVGVDMILGAREDGRDDRVLEVNPRLTTSFVGHARGAAASLLRAVVEAAAGRDPGVPFSRGPVAFSVEADDQTVDR